MDFEKIRTFCLSMPGTSEGIKYGDGLYFMVMGKVFCSSRLPELNTANFKVPDEQFDELCERHGIAPAPYGGAKFKWVQVSDWEALSSSEWETFLQLSYEEAKAKLPKKVREGL